MPGHCANFQRAFRDANEIEFSKVIQVDQMLWPGEPHIQHRA